MYARVVRHEDGDPDVMRSEAARLTEQMSDAPPEGVPAKAFLLLIDPDGGRSLAINLFETDDDRRRGHEVLEGMSPGGGYGRRVSVEMYEVGADLQWERGQDQRLEAVGLSEQAMSRENVELVRRVYEGWARGDFRAGSDLFAPNFEWKQRPDAVEPGSRRGPAIGTALRRILDVWQD